MAVTYTALVALAIVASAAGQYWIYPSYPGLVNSNYWNTGIWNVGSNVIGGGQLPFPRTIEDDDCFQAPVVAGAKDRDCLLAPSDQFTFNYRTGTCELIEYGGCSGSRNLFTTVQACKQTCGKYFRQTKYIPGVQILKK